MLVTLLQAATIAIGGAIAAPPDLSAGFSLDKLKAIPACPKPVDGEIVVCAPRDAVSQYRLPRLSERPEAGPPRAETQIGDATMGIDTESATLAAGAVSQRVMVRIKISF